MAIIRTDNVYSIRSLYDMYGANFDIWVINYHKEIFFYPLFSIPKELKIIRYISYEYDAIIIFCAKMDISGEKMSTVSVYEKGKIIGITDSFYSGERYADGIKEFVTSSGSIFAVRDRSFFFSEESNSTVYPGIFVFVTNDCFAKEDYECVLKFNSDRICFIGVYKDVIVKRLVSLSVSLPGEETEVYFR